MTDRPIHNVWMQMIQRCENPNHKAHKHYGGRGINVCERWHSFENFFADMGSTYAPGLTIDRIDNDGNYKPGNCRWIPQSEQLKNRRPSCDWLWKA